MQVIRERTKREALLTEAEKQLLLSGEIDRKSKSKLCKKLDRRLTYLIEDLNKIISSPSLEAWRALKRVELNSELYQLSAKLKELANQNYKRTYLDKICMEKRKNKNVYWVETSLPMRYLNYIVTKKRPYYTLQIFELKHVLRGNRATKKIKQILLDAYVQQIIPKDKNNAIDIDMIKDILYQKSKHKQVDQTRSKNERCKKCGYVLSPSCPDCLKKSHEEFVEMIKDVDIPDLVMFGKIDLKKNSNSKS